MSGPSASDVTRWLAEWREGDERALERLFPLVYGELRRLASRYLDREREGHTFQTHDLIHEAFLRLIPQRHVDWQSRNHFFAVAAQMMLRFFGGLEHGEIASVLGVSKPTVQRRWRTAKAWLYHRLQPVEESHGR